MLQCRLYSGMELPPYGEMMRLIQEKRRELGIDQATLAQKADLAAAQLERMENVETHANYATVRQLWDQLQRMEREEEATAADAMHDSIDWIDASQHASQAQKIMYDNDYLQMPVKEETDDRVYRNVGSLTEADLSRTEDLDRPVGEIMGEPFREVDASTPLPQVEKLLSDGYNALLVTRDGRYVGIITKSDLVKKGYLR